MRRRKKYLDKNIPKAETGQQLPRQRTDGNRRSDDGKPKALTAYRGKHGGGHTGQRVCRKQTGFRAFLR
jgi:hypothetical protein